MADSIVLDRFAEPHRFPMVSCSQCGSEFGPGNFGYSHCSDHRQQPVNRPVATAPRLEKTVYVVIECEPYGKRLQIERVYGPFATEAAAKEFTRDYSREYEMRVEDAIGDGVLRIEKLAGKKP